MALRSFCSTLSAIFSWSRVLRLDRKCTPKHLFYQFYSTPFWNCRGGIDAKQYATADHPSVDQSIARYISFVSLLACHSRITRTSISYQERLHQRFRSRFTRTLNDPDRSDDFILALETVLANTKILPNTTRLPFDESIDQFGYVSQELEAISYAILHAHDLELLE